MKFFIVLFLAVAAVAASDFTEDEEKLWIEFKQEHGRLFLSKGKEKARKETFIKRARDVNAHNDAFLNGEHTWTKGLHKYSDLPEDQFKQRFTGIQRPDTRDTAPVVDLRQTPPPSIDLRSQTGVSPIRDQNPCGSCWAFSTSAALEYVYWRKYGRTIDVSEQQLVDCVYKDYTADDGSPRDGCDGGWMPETLTWISKMGGQLKESDYPYAKLDRAQTCRTNSFPTKSVFVNQRTPYVSIANNDNSIKNALSQYGVLMVCVDASDWENYSGGIFRSYNYAQPECQHAVAIVGYGTENGVPYWIIRNSWDTWFGEKGYIRVNAQRDPSTNTNYGGMMTDTVFAAVLA